MTWKSRPWRGSLPRGRPRPRPPDDKKCGEEDGSLPLRNNGRMNQPDPHCQVYFTILWMHIARLFKNFLLRRIHDRDPSFRSVTSLRQRRAINLLICRRFDDLLGWGLREIPYTVRCSATRAGIFWADLEAESEGVKREFHIGIANARAKPKFGDGFHAQRIEGNVLRSETRLAARPSWLPVFLDFLELLELLGL